MRPYYRAWHYLLRAVVPTLTYIKVRGIHNIPQTGPCMFVSNHISMADPPCLVAYLPRQAHFMTKAEAFDQWPLSVLLPPGEPIKIHRGRVDRQALRLAEQYLNNGEPIVIYAEGTRAKAGEAQEARAGVVFLAQRTGAPIVPVAISGTDRLFSKRFPWYRRGRTQLTFGPPFYLADLGAVTRNNRDALAQAVMARVADLLPLNYRGVYGMPSITPAADAAPTTTGAAASTAVIDREG